MRGERGSDDSFRSSKMLEGPLGLVGHVETDDT